MAGRGARRRRPGAARAGRGQRHLGRREPLSVRRAAGRAQHRRPAVETDRTGPVVDSRARPIRDPGRRLQRPDHRPVGRRRHAGPRRPPGQRHAANDAADRARRAGSDATRANRPARLVHRRCDLADRALPVPHPLSVVGHQQVRGTRLRPRAPPAARRADRRPARPRRSDDGLRRDPRDQQGRPLGLHALHPARRRPVHSRARHGGAARGVHRPAVRQSGRPRQRDAEPWARRQCPEHRSPGPYAGDGRHRDVRGDTRRRARAGGAPTRRPAAGSDQSTGGGGGDSTPWAVLALLLVAAAAFAVAGFGARRRARARIT